MTQTIVSDDDKPAEEEHEEEEEVFTQRPRSLSQPNVVNGKGLKLFTTYLEITHKRAALETEKEVLFLSERGVQETPFRTEEVRDLNPVLRKDFLLQV